MRTWTHQPLCAGGKLIVCQMFPAKSIFRAQMDWPGVRTVVGRISTDLDGALDYLETALTDDAANEMLESGGV